MSASTTSVTTSTTSQGQTSITTTTQTSATAPTSTTAATTGSTTTSTSTSTTASTTVGTTSSNTSLQCPSLITTTASFSCTASVSPSAATGAITFSTQSGGSLTNYHHCTLSGGSCSDTFTYNGDVGGGSTVAITANYQGDGTYAPSTSSLVDIQVQGMSTTSTTTSTTSAYVTYTLSITYVVTNSTICNPYPLVQCTWSGTITWPNTSCTNGCYSSYIIGPINGNSVYHVSYSTAFIGQSGYSMTWSLSMITPPSESTLTLIVTDQNGNVVSDQNTTPCTSGFSGSYQPGTTPATSTATTSTSCTPTTTSTATSSTNTYSFPTTSYVTMFDLNKTACLLYACSYSFQWDVVDNVGCTSLLCSDGASGTNMSQAIDFPTCADSMTWTFSLNEPAYSSLTFVIKNGSGGVMLQQSTSPTQSTLSGRWAPPCSASPTSLRSQMSSLPGTGPTGGGLHDYAIVAGFVGCGITIMASTFVSLGFSLKRRNPRRGR